MKQKISVVLARTNWDGATTAWQEHKIVETDEVMQDCSIFCQLAIEEKEGEEE